MGDDGEATMAFFIRAEYDAKLDIVFYYPCGHIRTETDCALVAKGWQEILAIHGRDRYSLTVMDMFTVDPAIREVFASYAAASSEDHRGVAVVVNYTASAAHGVASSIDSQDGDVLFASSVEDGIAMLLKIRESRAARQTFFPSVAKHPSERDKSTIAADEMMRAKVTRLRSGRES